MQSWFDVDRDGLRKVLERKGKAFIVLELLQNAWDENVSQVDCTLERLKGRNFLLTVQDDSPEGFSDLRHAFTLFAESPKKGNPNQRGRFDIGEKFVLACCDHAKITTTKGTIEFLPGGNRRHSQNHVFYGTIFEAYLKLTKEEEQEITQAIASVIPQEGIITQYNGVQLVARKAIVDFEVSLPTVLSDDDGSLRPTIRKTQVTIYEPLAGEKAMLYEMGIPVVETGDQYHVNVMQKVPLNMDRDNVTPAYMKKVRVAVLNNTFSLLNGEEDTNQAWVRDALEDKNCKPDAARHIVVERFGKDAVTYDPSDPEGSKIAASQGRTVIPGAAFNKKQWENIRQTDAAKPAGKVTPSPKPYSMDGKPLNVISSMDFTNKQRAVVRYARIIGEKLLGTDIEVQIVKEPRASWPYSATFGPDGTLTLNASVLTKFFFSEFPDNCERVDRLLLHEFAHYKVSDHLSSKFYEEVARLGAKLTKIALVSPETFSVREVTV
jgi:hypothetical protein